MESLIALANALPTLGISGLLALIFILFLGGKLHTESEKKDWKDLYESERQEKLQALVDRKASDDAVSKLTETLKEHDLITTRSLDLTERLLEEQQNPRRRGSN